MANKILKGGISNYIYRWDTNAGACDSCQELNNTIYNSENDIPEKPHPNCKCSVEMIEDNTNNNPSDDIEYHELLRQASIYVYHGTNAKIPKGYEKIENKENSNNGFYANVLSNGNDIVITYRGTDWKSKQDLQNDIAMAHSKIPAQAADAISLYDKINREFPNSPITVTGHSLGGSLAEIVSGVRGVPAVTFNAYGVKDMFKNGTKLNENKIINYVNEWDAISMINGENHLGSIYSVPNIGNGKIETHSAEGMDNLSKRITRNTEDIRKNCNRLHPRSSELKDKLSSGFDKTEKLRNKIKQEIEEQRIRKENNYSEFKHARQKSNY